MAKELPTTSTTLIRAVQVWSVSQRLELLSSYGDISSLSFVQKVVLDKLLHLEKTSAGAWLGLPFAPKGNVEAVVVLFCKIQQVALELWHPGASGKLELFYGIYGSQHFENVSRNTRFSVLEGLPSQTFDKAEPVLFETLTRQRGFLRAEAAVEAGLVAGLGIPLLERDSVKSALVLLTSKQTPLAQSLEIWKDQKRQSVFELEPHYHHDQSGHATQIVHDVYKQKLPVLCDNVLALPSFKAGRVSSVVVMRF
ncbi:MAG: hypothetical protein ACRCYY_10285 [Trueperaceae bacterium]